MSVLGRESLEPPRIDWVWSRAISGLEQRLSLSVWEDLVWYSAGGRCALCVSFGGGETPMVVSEVLGDISVALAADVLRRR